VVELTPARRVMALTLLAAALVCEGFDVTAASFAAPDIMRDFGMTKAGLGPFLTASALGMLFGSALLASLGDRIGRRPIVIAGTAGYSAIMLLSTMSTALWQLTLLRFLIGLCVGAVLPNAIVLAGELVKEASRPRTSAAVTLGISLGSTLAGVAAAMLLPAYGWRGFFLFGGAVPLLFSLLLWAALPESPEFGRNRSGTAGPRPNVASLFRDGLTEKTLTIWVLIVLLSMTLYLLSSWTPLLLRESGLDARQASLVGGGYYFGGLTGCVVAALLLGRSGWSTLAIFLLLAAVAVLAVSRVDGPMLPLALAVAAAGAFVTGSQAAFNGLAASAYPLGLRATGFGSALAIARIGSVSGPMVGAALISAGLDDAQSLFIVPVGPLLIAAAAASWLWYRQRSAARVKEVS
jgi:AAHS family 4-hydroxybenzoate transporter-like MFS transporter